MNRDEGATSSIVIPSYRFNRRNVLTFISYMLPGVSADRVSSIAQLSFVEAYRIQSKRQKATEAASCSNGQQHHIPLRLVLFCANKATRKIREKELTEDAISPALLSVDEKNEEAVRSVVSIPRLERSMFVLCAILGLESREATHVLQVPPVKGEKILARAVHTFYANQPSLKHIPLYATASGQIMSSDAMDEVKATVDNFRLKVECAEHDAGSEEALRNVVFTVEKARSRRRRAIYAAAAVGAVGLLTVLSSIFRPWRYLESPVSVVLSTNVRPYYTQRVGFAPRLPSSLPHTMKDTPSEVSIGALGSDFSISYEDNTTRTIITIEETQAANALPIPKQSNASREVLYIHGVRAVIQGTTSYDTVQFDVQGVHCTVTAEWPAFTTGFSKDDVRHLVRSMITNPAKVNALPVYQNLTYNGEAAAKSALSFRPILLSRKGLIGVSPIPSTVSADVQSKGTQRFEVFSAVYTGVRVRQQVRLHEYWGAITESGGTRAASQDYAPVQQILHIEGHSVHFRPDNMGLYWYDAKTGIGFEIIGQPQSKSELISVMKNIMSQIKAQ